MKCVFAAEAAIFVHFESVGVVLLVFLRVVISLLANCAGKGYFVSHSAPPIKFLSHGRTATV